MVPVSACAAGHRAVPAGDDEPRRLLGRALDRLVHLLGLEHADLGAPPCLFEGRHDLVPELVAGGLCRTALAIDQHGDLLFRHGCVTSLCGEGSQAK